MDVGQQEKLEQEKLERARARLTPEQRDILNYYCDVRLREEEQAYAPKHEIALADVLYEARRGHQKSDLEEVITKARNEARVREAKERHAADPTALKEAELQRGQPAQGSAGPAQRGPELTSQRTDAEESRLQQLRGNAAQLRRNDDPTAGAWVSQAETLDRQRHQHGRYDALKGGSPPPPPGSPPAGGLPNDPQPPPNAPLNANEVLQRFGNPKLAARYQHQDQQHREDQNRAAPGKPAVGGNVPSEKRAEQLDSVEKRFQEVASRFTRGNREDARERDNERGHEHGGGRGGRGRTRR